MSRMKERTLYGIRRRGCNLFLTEEAGDSGFTGFGPESLLLRSEPEAEARMQRLDDRTGLEIQAVGVSFPAHLPAAARVRAEAAQQHV